MNGEHTRHDAIARTTAILLLFAYGAASSLSCGSAKEDGHSTQADPVKSGVPMPRATAPKEGQPLFVIYVNQGGTLKYGYIDKGGRVVVKPQFDYAQYFSEGLAVVTPKLHGKEGYINKEGRMAIPPQFDDTSPFSEGYAAVQVAGKYGYIDQEGKTVIKPAFDEGRSFHDGLAFVRVGQNFGYINKEGKFAIEPRFEYNSDLRNGSEFSESLAWIRVGRKFGYIDTSGKLVIEAQYESAGVFSEGLAYVKIGGKYGYINHEGKLIIAPQFDDPESFSEGFATVKLRDVEVCIDRSGQPLKPEGGTCRRYHDGLAIIKDDAGNVGFVDQAGRVVIKPQFDVRETRDFDGGLAKACRQSGAGYICGYIDKTGKFVWSNPD